MFGQRVEERIDFTQDERRTILLRTGCHCAACGKKLTMEHFTVDHIIPISRGGTNDLENLIALCGPCNKAKGNTVFFPGDFYNWWLFENPKSFKRVQEYVYDWVKENVDDFPIVKYPLLSPVSTMMINTTGIMPKHYNPQFIFDIVYMNREMRAAFRNRYNYEDGFPFYAVMRRNSNTVILILRLQYDPKYEVDGKNFRQMTCYVAYSSLDGRVERLAVKGVIFGVADRLKRIGLMPDQLIIASDKKEILKMNWNDVDTLNLLAFPKKVVPMEGVGRLNGHAEDRVTPFVAMDLTDAVTQAELRERERLIKNGGIQE